MGVSSLLTVLKKLLWFSYDSLPQTGAFDFMLFLPKQFSNDELITWPSKDTFMKHQGQNVRVVKHWPNLCQNT